MLPTTESGRRFFAGAALLALTATLCFGVRGKAAPYIPDAPAYRQKGPASAPVVIAEYSDFQCPACQAASVPLKRILKLFPGKIRLVFKHFPWDFHDWARDAAIASECAGREGDFWTFHDNLFASRSWVQAKSKKDIRTAMLAFARDLKLNEGSFTACLDDPKVGAVIDQELQDAKKHWIGSTPTFLINGRRFVGALQLRTQGLNHIEDILKK